MLGKMKIFLILPVLVLLELPYGNGLPNFQTIPEASRLPDLDYNSLPEFVRKYLPAEKIDVRTEPNKNRKRTDNENTNPRTYGMKLTNDKGVVWNDMVSPRISYRVGSKQNNANENKKDIDDIIETMVNKIGNQVTARPTTNEYEVTTEYVRTTPNVVTAKNFWTTTSPKTTPMPKKGSEKELLKQFGNKLDNIIKDVNKHIEKLKDTSSEIKKGDSGNEDYTSDTGKDLGKSKITKQPAFEQHKPAIPNLLEQIIQNDELWQWLSDNIAKYLEILMARMGEVIQEDVEVLLQAYFEKHQCGCGRNNSRHNINRKHNKTSDIHKKEDGQKNNTNVDKDTKFSNNNTVDDNVFKHKKEHHLEQNQNDKSEKEKTCEKSVIYGNSIGNEKVTNVFIFNMNSDDKSLITSNNSTGSHTINFDKNATNDDKDSNKDDKPSNEDNKDSNKDEKQSNKDNKDSNEDDENSNEDDKDSNKGDENSIEDDKDSNKDDENSIEDDKDSNKYEKKSNKDVKTKSNNVDKNKPKKDDKIKLNKVDKNKPKKDDKNKSSIVDENKPKEDEKNKSNIVDENKPKEDEKNKSNNVDKIKLKKEDKNKRNKNTEKTTTESEIEKDETNDNSSNVSDSKEDSSEEDTTVLITTKKSKTKETTDDQNENEGGNGEESTEDTTELETVSEKGAEDTPVEKTKGKKKKKEDV